MKRFLGAYALALSSAAILPALTAAAHAEEVVVGYQQIVGPFLSAIADGRFDAVLKDAGYEVEWRQFTSGGDISTALASGDVPVGVMGSTGIAAATTRGVELQLFWILDDIGHSEQLVARDGSGIATPADLVGKTVGVPFVSTSHFHLLVGLQNVWGIDPRDVKILNMQPPQIVAAWQRGDIDAAYVWPPALSEILKSGTAISDSAEIGAASVPTFDGLVVDTGFAEDNPKFMAAFTKVLAEAYQDYADAGASWTAESPQVQGIVQLIGGTPEDALGALKLLGYPTLPEQTSDKWLGGGAARAIATSAAFLEDQKQLDSLLDDYAPVVNAGPATQLTN